MTVRVRDHGFRRFAAGLPALRAGTTVSAGIDAEAGAREHRPGVTIADVAAGQEFASPFIRPAVDADRGTLERAMVAAGRGAVTEAMRGSRPTWRALVQAAERTAERMRAAAPRRTGALAGAIAAKVTR